jgi:hypothetical protein
MPAKKKYDDSKNKEELVKRMKMSYDCVFEGVCEVLGVECDYENPDEVIKLI